MINEKQKERMAKVALDFCNTHRLDSDAIIYAEGDSEGCATLCMGQGQTIILTIHSIIRKFAEETNKDFIDVIQALIEIDEAYKDLPNVLAPDPEEDEQDE